MRGWDHFDQRHSGLKECEIRIQLSEHPAEAKSGVLSLSLGCTECPSEIPFQHFHVVLSCCSSNCELPHLVYFLQDSMNPSDDVLGPLHAVFSKLSNDFGQHYKYFRSRGNCLLTGT